MFKVLIPQPIDSSGLDYLQAHSCEPVFCPTEAAAVQSLLPSCDACLSKTFFIENAWLAAAPRLKVVGKHGVGWDNVVDADAAAALGIRVVNTPLANTNAVAEQTIGMMLALARQLTAMDRAVRTSDHDFADQNPGCELAGKTLGLAGLGRIGSTVARKACYGLDMKILAYDPFARPAAFTGGITRVDSLAELFSRSDVVSLHLPGHAATRGLIGRDLLALLHRDALLINCARGSVIDQDALVNLLRARRIAGAALDVYDPEPLPAGHPLLSLDNVLLTPHSAALTREALQRMSLQVCQGIVDVLEDREPAWPVNKTGRR